MRTCPRTRSLVPRSPQESRVWRLQTGRTQASGYGDSGRVGCEGANRDLGSCLAQRPALLLFWGVWLPRRRRRPRVKRERRHPMCITKNARQQATTQPRSHSRAPPLGGGEGTAATLSDLSPPPASPSPDRPLPRMEIAVERSVFHLPPCRLWHGYIGRTIRDCLGAAVCKRCRIRNVP